MNDSGSESADGPDENRHGGPVEMAEQVTLVLFLRNIQKAMS